MRNFAQLTDGRNAPPHGGGARRFTSETSELCRRTRAVLLAFWGCDGLWVVLRSNSDRSSIQQRRDDIPAQQGISSAPPLTRSLIPGMPPFRAKDIIDVGRIHGERDCHGRCDCRWNASVPLGASETQSARRSASPPTIVHEWTKVGALLHAPKVQST